MDVKKMLSKPVVRNTKLVELNVGLRALGSWWKRN